MIVWTPVPLEYVLDGWEKPRNFQKVNWRGKEMLVESCGSYSARIVQLLSSEPRDFLRPDLQPGTEITFSSSLLLKEIPPLKCIAE